MPGEVALIKSTPRTHQVNWGHGSTGSSSWGPADALLTGTSTTLDTCLCNTIWFDRVAFFRTMCVTGTLLAGHTQHCPITGSPLQCLGGVTAYFRGAEIPMWTNE